MIWRWNLYLPKYDTSYFVEGRTMFGFVCCEALCEVVGLELPHLITLEFGDEPFEGAVEVKVHFNFATKLYTINGRVLHLEVEYFLDAAGFQNKCRENEGNVTAAWVKAYPRVEEAKDGEKSEAL